MKVLVGLGNPGETYRRHRHNIGFMAVEAIARRHDFSDWKKKFNAEIAQGAINGQKVLLVKPQIYMNKSGEAVQAVMTFHKVIPNDVIVFYDELDLEPCKIRIKKGGGAGGHNGIRSIDAHIGTEYWRVRMGIGHPGDKSRVSPYVLGNFSSAETVKVETMMQATADACHFLIEEKMDKFMTKVALDLQESGSI